MGERRLLSTLAVAVALLVPAALAWACTPSANVSVRPASAPAGAAVKVTGREFLDGPVEIRFASLRGGHSAAGRGRLLRKVRGPSFSVRVRVPRVRAGRHLVVAVGRGADGHTYVARAAVAVRRPARR